MPPLPGRVIVGAQWGDEGKGKLVDLLAADADVVVRYQGGTNAGHTLVVGGRKTVLHLVPSGILHPGKLCVIGPGCVVDPVALLSEIDSLRAAGVQVGPENLAVSDSAPTILEVHKRLDRAREGLKGGVKIGTTGRGIGPAYEDAIARRAIRTGDLLDASRLAARAEGMVFEKQALLSAYGEPGVTAAEILGPLEAIRDRLAPFLTDTGALLARRRADGARLLFEGAQGAMLDVWHGTYPYVTSSSTVAPNAAVGSGLGPDALGEVIGVAKAYATRVGEGPFTTELDNAQGEHLRQVGHEFGATTGRPRRCGWLDLPALRLAKRINGLTTLALTKLDVLRGITPLRICDAWLWRGEVHEVMPTSPAAWHEAVPRYLDLPGFDEDISAARRPEDLPRNARAFVERIAAEVDLPLRLVSVGPGRDENVMYTP